MSSNPSFKLSDKVKDIQLKTKDVNLCCVVNLIPRRTIWPPKRLKRLEISTWCNSVLAILLESTVSRIRWETVSLLCWTVKTQTFTQQTYCTLVLMGLPKFITPEILDDSWLDDSYWLYEVYPKRGPISGPQRKKRRYLFIMFSVT